MDCIVERWVTAEPSSRESILAEYKRHDIGITHLYAQKDEFMVTYYCTFTTRKEAARAVKLFGGWSFDGTHNEELVAHLLSSSSIVDQNDDNSDEDSSPNVRTAPELVKQSKDTHNKQLPTRPDLGQKCR